MDPQSGLIVVNKSQFLEFIHEEIDAAPRRNDHLRECFLGYLGNRGFGLTVLPVTGE